MATAQVLFQRFYYMASLKEFGILVSFLRLYRRNKRDRTDVCFGKEIGMGALFLASKVEESFVRLSFVVDVYDYLLRRAKGEPTHPTLDQFSQVSKQ